MRSPFSFVFALFVFLHVCVAPLQAESPNTFTADQELATFQLPDGFEANLFASEEMGVLNPMQMRWDAQGRLYVISTLAYPQLRPGEIPNDKIIRLTDTDGDGRADKSEVVVDGLNIPTGLELGEGGIIVGEQTDLVLFTDKDGDGKHEDRKVLLSGFGVGDTHQAINSFVWSPGGELYINQGDGIESRVETPWGVSGLFQAGVMRFRPKRLQLDPFLDDFMGPGNPWGVAFDDWGQTFVIDGAGGITFLSPAMMPVHHKRQLRQIGEAGGYCGIDVIGSQHMPDDWQGDFVIADFQRMRIKRFALQPNGAGFNVEWKDPVVESSHRNFRPVDIRTGPDGAIYICDWYNSVICHQDDPFRHPDRDFTHGRIWRITNKNKPTVKVPNLKAQTVAQLYKHLASPERWVRYQAKRVLSMRHPSDVANTASRWNSEHAIDQDEHHLLEIIGALESVERVNPDLLQHLISASDHRGRAYAARVVGRWHDRMPNALAMLERLANDPHPLVRMEAAVAAAHIPDAHAAEVAAIVADQPMDYDLDYALSQSLQHLKKYWVPAFKRGELSFGGKPNRLAAALERVNSSELLDSVRTMARSSEVDSQTRLASLKTLARVGNEEDLSLVLDGAINDSENSIELLDELKSATVARSLRPATGRERIGPLFDSSPLAITLAGRWQVEPLFDQIAELAIDEDGSPATREVAIESLGYFEGASAKESLKKIARSTKPESRFASIVAMCRFQTPEAARHAVNFLASNELTESQNTKLVRAFAARDGGLATLAKQFLGSDVNTRAATGLLNALSATGIANDQLLEVLNSAAGVSLSLPEYSEELVTELVSQITGGNAIHGAKLFHSQRTNCNKCHKIAGQGGQIGPELSGVGTTMPKDRLVQEVMWPQRLVKDGYQLEQVLTGDGEIFQGYMQKSRDRKHYYLKPLDSETVLKISKEEVDEHDEIGSAMPENIVAALTPRERIDLLAFLSQLGTPDGVTGVENKQ